MLNYVNIIYRILVEICIDISVGKSCVSGTRLMNAGTPDVERIFIFFGSFDSVLVP